MPTSARAAEKWLQFLCIRWYAFPLYSFPSSSIILSTSSSVKSVVPKAMDSLVKNRTHNRKCGKIHWREWYRPREKEMVRHWQEGQNENMGMHIWDYQSLSLMKWHSNVPSLSTKQVTAQATAPRASCSPLGKSQLWGSAPTLPTVPQ